MKKSRFPVPQGGVVDFSRRRFVQGLTLGGVMAGLGGYARPGWALHVPAPLPELRGTEFDLVIDALPVNFTGKPAVAVAINGAVPAPTLRWREGDTVTLWVTNRLKEWTSIHWHGILLPFQMDGVPGFSFAGIAPGQTYTYQFKVKQSGTYWYHSHSGFQEQQGHYGALVIEPREPDPFEYQSDHVVMLSDWTDDSPEFVLSRLKKMDGYYNYAKLTAADFIKNARKQGFSNALDDQLMWDQMRMNPRDLADVSAATYTYLMNGKTPSGNWTGVFKRGEKMRLRFINGSAMTYFDVRIPGLKMQVVSADGINVHPVSVDEFRIGVAETFDVLVEPNDDRAYTVFAQSMDRSGYARGTLAPAKGMTADVPALDPVPTLAMADMGMSMSGMHHGAHGAHGGHAGMPGMDHSKHGTGTAPADMSGMDHSQHGMAMPGMDHSQHGTAMPEMDHSQHGMDMPGMDHTQPSSVMAGMDHSQQNGATPGTLQVKKHPKTERGPNTDMQADELSTRLDDPGVGLRNNGRRVLTYADLKSLDGRMDPRDPGRTIELHLTGNMERYMWSFDGVPFEEAAPIHLKYGERVRFLLINDTMMEHPIHLHGMWSDMENEKGELQLRKHTVSVKPGHAIAYRVHADAIGRWAYHCHLMYHMHAGMFREVRVS